MRKEASSSALLETTERREKKNVRISDTLRVGVATNPPLAMVNSKGIWSGYAIDLFMEAARNASLSFEFVELNPSMIPGAITDGCKFPRACENAQFFSHCWMLGMSLEGL